MTDHNDRELLERAARAAGYWDNEFNCYQGPLNWNPIDNDGDALRLAVKLCIGIDHNRAGDQQRYVAAERPGCEGCFAPVCCVESEFDENNRASATRRAIVRAAAATVEGGA